MLCCFVYYLVFHLLIYDYLSRHRQWEATVHGPIVGHYAAERTFFCDVTPPSKDPVHGNDDAPSAEPAVLAAAVAAASAAKAAAIKEARGADAERQYDDVVDNASEVSSRAQRVCAVDALSVPTPSPPFLFLFLLYCLPLFLLYCLQDVIAGMLREAQMALHLPAAFGGKGADVGDAAIDDDECVA